MAFIASVNKLSNTFGEIVAGIILHKNKQEGITYPVCIGEQPNVPVMQLFETLCQNDICKPVYVNIAPQCTYHGWAYTPAFGNGMGIMSDNILPGGEIVFDVPVDTTLYLAKTFLYGEPTQENGYKADFYADFIRVEVNAEVWSITQDGLVDSPQGKTIIPAESQIKIVNVKGVEHLPELTRPWVRNLYNLIEAVAIVP